MHLILIELALLVAGLGGPTYKGREAATHSLKVHPDATLEYLLPVYHSTKDPEVKFRLKDVLWVKWQEEKAEIYEDVYNGMDLSERAFKDELSRRFYKDE